VTVKDGGVIVKDKVVTIRDGITVRATVTQGTVTQISQ